MNDSIQLREMEELLRDVSDDVLREIHKFVLDMNLRCDMTLKEVIVKRYKEEHLMCHPDRLLEQLYAYAYVMATWNAGAEDTDEYATLIASKLWGKVSQYEYNKAYNNAASKYEEPFFLEAQKEQVRLIRTIVRLSA